MRHYHLQKGFTLLEIILASIISLSIMAGAFAVYKKAQADQNTKDTYEIVKALFVDAQAISSTRNDFWLDNAGGGTRAINVAELVAAKGSVEEYPRGAFLIDATTMSHPLGGRLIVQSQTSGSGVRDLIEVRLFDVPRQQCPLLLARLINANIYDMYVDNRLVGLAPAATANALGRDEVRMDHATTLCSNVGRYVTIRARQLKEINYSKMRAGPFGATMSASEAAVLGPLYARQEVAMAARETAQLAIP